ncbi:hypothetical protein [Microbacterium memoriense]|uniref:LPXTG cell wall anchor domain-containing protein n=1 Tax=Microbacterium memoriense TaxID=2978350 RepID=A0ABT2PEX5_9MICO|nr:hypothetical protein [Microbacterium memoriense]MCT9003140.1 hypothetical protein [Microbacterium memoriense]
MGHGVVGIELPQGAAPIPSSNEVLHLIAPLILLVAFFVVWIGRRRRAKLGR